MDFSALRIATSLVSPWPTWRVEAEDEPSLLARLAVGGPVPQADLFEPWEPGDPWMARVVVPTPEPEVLLTQGVLEDGVAPGLTEWVDRGRVGEDVLSCGSVEAICLSDLESGGLLIPDLVHHETDDLGLVAVAQALLAACGARSDGDQVTLVQHRSTGRFGLLLEVVVPDREPLEERQAVIDAVASVLSSDPPVKLSPDLRWWFDLQRVVVLAWLIAPARPLLPSAPFRQGAVGGLGQCELQVPLDEADALVLGEQVGAHGFVGTRSRWLEVEGVLRFVPCWTGPAGPDAPSPTVPHRVVPACPPGLEGDWLGIDPDWWIGGHGVVCRWHCSLRDRDLLPRITPRDGDAIDRRIAAEISALGPVEPVFAGRAALQLDLPALTGADWQGVVDALGALQEPELAPEVYVAMRSKYTLLLFRCDLAPEEGEPIWEAR